MCSNDHTKEYDRLIDLGLSVRAYNYCQRNRINTTSDLIEFFKKNDYTIPFGFKAGRGTIQELTKVCNELIKKLNIDTYIDNDNNSIITWGLSTRAYNYCQSLRLISRNSIVRHYLSNGRCIPPKVNVGNKTIKEIESLCVKFLKDDPSLLNSCGYIQMDQEETCLGLLSTEDRDYVSSFLKNHNHYPILWMLSRYIDNNKDALCFSLVYGIDSNRDVKTIFELSKEYNVTQSRIGQIVNNGYRILFSDNSPQYAQKIFQEVFSKKRVQYLIDAISEFDVLCSSDPIPIIKEICRSEKVAFTTAFVLRFISSYTDRFTRIGNFERNNANTQVLLINENISSVFDIESFCSQFESLLNNLSERTILNFREYVEDSSCWIKYSVSYSDRILRACKSIILSRYNIYDEDGGDTLIIYPKKVDLGSVVYGIISSSNIPLTIEEISNRIDSLYTPGKYSVIQIKLAIREDKRIQFKRDGGGKTKYLLASDSIPSSVRDAIVRVLEQSLVPVSLDEIVDFVLLHFPSSSKKSVRTTMLNDGRSRFIQFTDGLFGLASKEYPPEYSIATDATRTSYEERLIELKKFVNEKHQFPLVDSDDSDEVSLARWLERNISKAEVKELLDTYKMIVWVDTCAKCETFIKSQGGKLPNKDRDSFLYKWIFKAAEDFNEGRLNQTQRKLYLHLKMIIKK